jgi:hypothetical protein
MGLYPKKYKQNDKINTDVVGIKANRKDIATYQWSETEAVAASNTGVHAGVILQEAVSSLSINMTNPATPRALRIKGNAAGIVGNVVIEGTNIADQAIAETIVANAANVVEGAKAFKTITRIVFPVRNAEADEIAIGWNDKLGLPWKLPVNTVLTAALDSVRESTAPTVTVSATAIESNTIDLSSALNGKAVDITLIV